MSASPSFESACRPSAQERHWRRTSPRVCSKIDLRPEIFHSSVVVVVCWKTCVGWASGQGPWGVGPAGGVPTAEAGLRPGLLTLGCCSRTGGGWFILVGGAERAGRACAGAREVEGRCWGATAGRTISWGDRRRVAPSGCPSASADGQPLYNLALELRTGWTRPLSMIAVVISYPSWPGGLSEARARPRGLELLRQRGRPLASCRAEAQRPAALASLALPKPTEARAYPWQTPTVAPADHASSLPSGEGGLGELGPSCGCCCAPLPVTHARAQPRRRRRPSDDHDRLSPPHPRPSPS